MAWFLLSAVCLYGGYKALVLVAQARQRLDDWDQMLRDYDDSLQERHR